MKKITTRESEKGNVLDVQDTYRKVTEEHKHKQWKLSNEKRLPESAKGNYIILFLCSLPWWWYLHAWEKFA